MPTVEHIYLDTTKPIDERVADLLGQMTLPEKIGQMTQIEKNSISPEDTTNYCIGSILSGGGGNPDPNTPTNWRSMVHEYLEAGLKTRLKIPVIYGVDAVHGHSNVVDATIFPHNIGLGATRDTDLMKRIGTATAREMLATGVHWNFSPCVTVPQDVRWGRTYEGYSEDTDIVIKMAMAFMEGFHAPELGDQKSLACAKHFIADGGTEWGSTQIPPWTLEGNWQVPDELFQIDQGNSIIDEETLREVHLKPYISAIDGGVMSVMISHSSWHGMKMHAHHYLITEVLKCELGFSGFVVSDWMSINQIDESYYIVCCEIAQCRSGYDHGSV